MNRTPRCVVAALVLVGMSFGAYAGNGSSNTKQDPWSIALDLNIPGKKGWNTCNLFAQSLHKRLTQAGIESHLVVYNWENDYRYSQTHAMVVYKDQDGRMWAMDQQMEKPRWISGSSAKQWIASFSPDTYNKLISCNSNSSALKKSHQMASKF